MRKSERINREILKKRILCAAWNLCGFKLDQKTVDTIKRGFELVQNCRYDLAEEIMLSDEMAAFVWKEANHESH